MRLKYEPASEPLHISVKYSHVVVGDGEELPPIVGASEFDVCRDQLLRARQKV